MNALITTANEQIQPSVGIKTILERFKAYINVKDITVKSYAVCLDCFMEWLQNNGIRQPRRSDMIEYIKFLASPHPIRQRRDRPRTAKEKIITFSAGTQARYLRAVKTFFKWTSQNTEPEDRMFYYPNIADNLKGAKVKADNTKRDPLRKDEARTVLESIDTTGEAGKRDYAMLMLAIMGGLRVIEMQRANIGNIETIAGEHFLYVQGKGHDEADDYTKLTPEVYSAIMAYLKTRDNTDAAEPLFASVGNRSKGQRLTEPSISRIIKKRLVAAGFNTHKIVAHSLRHTSITLYLESGATVQEAQYHARHTAITSTGIYSHNIDKRKQNSEQQIYNFIFDIEKDPAAQAVDCMKRMNSEQQRRALELLKAIAG